MENKNIEDLLLNSFDKKITLTEEEVLKQGLSNNSEAKKMNNHFLQIRELLANKEESTFGFFFAERVINKIKVLQDDVEYQLFSLVKRFRLLALGLIIALLSINIVLADGLSVKSILGLEDDTITELVQIDLYKEIIK